jgi:hypothetical protein
MVKWKGQVNEALPESDGAVLAPFTGAAHALGRIGHTEVPCVLLILRFQVAELSSSSAISIYTNAVSII